jgi:hypothetical protein
MNFRELEEKWKYSEKIQHLLKKICLWGRETRRLLERGT